MWNIIGGLTKPLIDLFRNRVLNKHTPRGVSLLLLGGIAFGYLDEKQVNLIVSLVSGGGIGYLDIWVLIINAGVLYLLWRGVKLLVRISDYYLEDKITKKLREGNGHIKRDTKYVREKITIENKHK